MSRDGGLRMSVTELHLLTDDRRPVSDTLEFDQVAPPLEHAPRHTPSIAVLILDHAPDPAEVSHLYDDFEIVLIAHDAASAVRMLQGMAPLPAPPVASAPPAAPVVSVTPLFDDVVPSVSAASTVSTARAAPAGHQLGLTLDEAHHLATWRGRPLPLTYRERAILGCLVADPGRVWTYRELFEHAWGGCYLGDPSLVHSALKRIRRKIREAGVALTIDAVRGVGFRVQTGDE